MLQTDVHTAQKAAVITTLKSDGFPEKIRKEIKPKKKRFEITPEHLWILGRRY